VGGHPHKALARATPAAIQAISRATVRNDPFQPVEAVPARAKCLQANTRRAVRFFCRTLSSQCAGERVANDDIWA